MFIQGFNLGLSAIGFMFQGNAFAYNLGLWLGLTLFGGIQALFVLCFFKKFITGGK